MEYKKIKNKEAGLLKGFTIIELLVVVAIIAVLASIVLVNVVQYIAKGKDAAARGNLATLSVNAAVFYDDIAKGNGTYVGWITAANPSPATGDSTYRSVREALVAGGYVLTANCETALCISPATKWCASTVLKVDNTKSYCVDSSGWRREGVTANNTCAGTGACPTT